METFFIKNVSIVLHGNSNGTTNKNIDCIDGAFHPVWF